MIVKKNYAFAKVTEKILLDFSKHVARIIELNKNLHRKKTEIIPKQSSLNTFINSLREFESEESLLSKVANIPNDLIQRDALIITTNPSNRVRESEFYLNSKNKEVENRLFDLVCRHKKLSIGQNNFFSIPLKNSDKRSFLSIPFNVLGKEAGSINLLSEASGNFNSKTIEALESIAKVTSQELERVRLKEQHLNAKETSDHLSWKHFALQAGIRIKDANRSKQNLSLVRIRISDIASIERRLGIECSAQVVQQIMRLVGQVKTRNSIACYLYGSEILMLIESVNAKRVIERLNRLIKRGFHELFPAESGKIVSEYLTCAISSSPKDGSTIQELVEDSRKRLGITANPANTLKKANVVQNATLNNLNNVYTKEKKENFVLGDAPNTKIQINA